MDELGSTQLDLVSPAALGGREVALTRTTRERLQDSIPENTRRAYDRIWRDFRTWCSANHREPMPATPETLAEFVSSLCDRDKSPATIEQAIAGIRTAHRFAGHGRHFPDAELALRVLKVHRRDRAVRGQSGQKQALPVRVEELRKMVDTIDQSTLLGARDHALLLLGIVLFGRRSELSALDWTDLTPAEDQNMRIRIRMSKTDQAAVGESIPVLWGAFPGTNPVRVLNRWREAVGSRGQDVGRLVRSVDRHGRLGSGLTGKAINEVVQRRALLAGLPRGFSAHSLRAGAATIAYMNGAPIATICRLGRWKPGSRVVLSYIRSVDEWKDHPFRGAL